MNMTTETERQLAAERKVTKKELAASWAAARDAAGDAAEAAWAAAEAAAGDAAGATQKKELIRICKLSEKEKSHV